MLPIVLSPHAARVGLAGAGEGFQRRLELIRDAGVTPVLFEERLPMPDEIAPLHLLFVAGLDETASAELARAARSHAVLVNVEDQPKLCDFHVPARLRRGDLLLTVSTGGRSPGLAAWLRAWLEGMFGPEWVGRVDEVANARARWRASGMAPAEIAVRTREWLDGKNWLP